MMMFEEIGECHFPIYWIDKLVPINGFFCEILSEMEREVVEILEEFYITSTREMGEYD